MNYEEEIRFIAGRVKELRLSKGWDVEEFAARLGLDGSNVRRIERGGTNLTVRSLCRIAGALDVSVAELVSHGPQRK